MIKELSNTVFPSSVNRMGILPRGLYLLMSVLLLQGLVVSSSQVIFVSRRNIRTFRAKGLGVAINSLIY